uniref:Uncharacterized protein n=1 Tax=Anguilla anguilla TaxID=7936 RepID=A0A0E9P8K6_ANGAN
MEPYQNALPSSASQVLLRGTDCLCIEQIFSSLGVNIVSAFVEA